MVAKGKFHKVHVLEILVVKKVVLGVLSVFQLKCLVHWSGSSYKFVKLLCCVCVAHLSMRSARNTMGTTGTPE